MYRFTHKLNSRSAQDNCTKTFSCRLSDAWPASWAQRYTVNAAYSQLVSEGFLQALPQRGFFVCHLDELILNEITEEKQLPPQKAEPILIDFSINDVARDKFPFQTWRKTMNKCFNEYDPDLLTSTPPQGDYRLRQAHCQLSLSGPQCKLYSRAGDHRRR